MTGVCCIKNEKKKKNKKFYAQKCPRLVRYNIARVYSRTVLSNEIWFCYSLITEPQQSPRLIKTGLSYNINHNTHSWYNNLKWNTKPWKRTKACALRKVYPQKKKKKQKKQIKINNDVPQIRLKIQIYIIVAPRFLLRRVHISNGILGEFF